MKTTATPKSPAGVDVCDIRNYSASIKATTVSDSTKRPEDQQEQQQQLQQQRQSSTIIETSLLSMLDNINSSSTKPRCTSSTIVSMTMGRSQANQGSTITTRTAQRTTRRDLEEQLQLEMERTDSEQERDSTSICAQPEPVGSALSPRLEMRLALNQDIMGDEDLISYDPGPDLTTILV